MSNGKQLTEMEAEEVDLLLQKIQLMGDEILASFRQLNDDIVVTFRQLNEHMDALEARRDQRSAFMREHVSTREIITGRVGYGVLPRYSEQLRSSANSVSSRDPEIFPWSAQ